MQDCTDSFCLIVTNKNIKMYDRGKNNKVKKGYFTFVNTEIIIHLKNAC